MIPSVFWSFFSFLLCYTLHLLSITTAVTSLDVINTFSPSISPSDSSSLPEEVTIFCRAFDIVDNTVSTTINYDVCSFSACEGDVIRIHLCSNEKGFCSGDTFLRLYSENIELDSNDDFCGSCSQITHQVLTPNCQIYDVREGCYGTTFCSGQVSITINHATPSVGPTNHPTMPTSRPTPYPSRPTIGPTLLPSVVPTLRPTAPPTSSPTISEQILVEVNNLVDSSPNPTLCTGYPISATSIGSCNLRSAVAYCLSIASSYTTTDECLITLPFSQIINLDENLGEISIPRTQIQGITIKIRGNGCTIRPLPDSLSRNFRFLNSNTTTATKMSIHLSNLILTSFGDLQNCGAVSLTGLVSGSFENIQFLSNQGNVGGAVCLSNVTRFRIQNCSFYGNTALVSGAGLYLGDSNSYVTIDHSGFVGNTAEFGSGGGAVYVSRYNNHITMSNLHIESNVAYYSGGGIYIGEFNDFLVLRNLTLLRNSAGDNGGGMYFLKSNNYVGCYLCNFIENIAENEGGGVYMNLDHYSATFKTSYWIGNIPSGVVLDQLNTHFICESCIFRFQDDQNGDSNEYGANLCGGGLVSYSMNDGLTLTSTLFESNRGGGVCLLGPHTSVKIVGCKFVSNSVLWRGGGGIYISRDTESLFIGETFFLWNRAVNGGGILLEDANLDATINSSYFIENTASGIGGAISLANQNNDDLMITRCNFSGNVASDMGGALFVGNSNYGLIVEQSNFISNSANYGGAIMMFSKNTDAIFYLSTFQNNYASTYGGAVAVGLNNYFMLFLVCRFDSNSAITAGGAIFSVIQNYEMSFTSSSLSRNTAEYGGSIYFGILNDGISFKTCTLDSNTGNRGGALYISQITSDIKFDQVHCMNNRAVYGGCGFICGTEITIRLSSFQNNLATGSCGGLYFLAVQNLWITSSKFFENAAKVSGGGLGIASSLQVQLQGVQIINNWAKQGGGLHLYLLGSFIITESNIFNNSVSEEGGGIFFDQVRSMTVKNTTITKNVASTGGGIYFSNSNVGDILDSVISFNSAQNGGGVGSGSYNQLTFSSSSFISNLGLFNGGGILVRSNHKYFSATACIFSSNKAQSGGAIFMVGPNSEGISISRCNFLNNSADKLGGAVSLASVNDALLDRVSFSQNYAADGGGLNLHDSQNLSITQSQFTSNQAFIGDGSALWMNATQLTLRNNSFIGNIAIGGGTLYWVSDGDAIEPIGLRECIFWNNSASYGLMWATNPKYLNLKSTEGILTPSTSTESSMVVVTEFDNYLPPLNFFLSDYYSQYISTINDKILDASVTRYDCGVNVGYLSGEKLVKVKYGEASFTSLQLYCIPKGSIELRVSTIVNDLELNSSILFQFRTCTRGEYFDGQSCVFCPNGSYSFTDNKDLVVSHCSVCPSEAQFCFKDLVSLKEGYWRISNTSSTPLICPHLHQGCRGGSGVENNLCHEGYEGPLCGVCSKNYYYVQSTNSCHKCEESSGLSVFVVIMIVFVCLLIVLYLLKHYCYERFVTLLIYDFKKITFEGLLISFAVNILNPPKNRPSSISLSGGRNRSLTMIELNAIKEYNKSVVKSLQTKLKLYISFYQIISSFPFVFNIQYPVAFQNILLFLQLSNLNILQNINVSCEVSIDYVDYLLTITILPFLLSSLLYVVYLIHYQYRVYYYPEQVQKNVHSLFVTYAFVFLIFTYLILTGVSTALFRYFHCVNIDPDNQTDAEETLYLEADYTISCTSQRYYFGLVWTIAMIFVYPIGIPVFYFFLLYRAKHYIKYRNLLNLRGRGRFQIPLHSASTQFISWVSSLSQLRSSLRLTLSPIEIVPSVPPEIVLAPIGFLFECYHPRYWYWEIIETFQRLLISGLLVLMRSGSSIQIVLGIVISLFFLKLYQSSSPFLDPITNIHKEVSQWQILFILLLTFLLQEQIFSQMDSSRAVYDTILVLVMILTPVVDSFFIIRNMIREYVEQSQSTESITLSPEDKKKKETELLKEKIQKHENQLNEMKKKLHKLTIIDPERERREELGEETSYWESEENGVELISAYGDSVVKSPIFPVNDNVEHCEEILTKSSERYPSNRTVKFVV